jgi:hypothetical protein
VLLLAVFPLAQWADLRIIFLTIRLALLLLDCFCFVFVVFLVCFQVFGIASQASHLRPLVQEYNMKQGEADAEEHFKAVERAYDQAEAIEREAQNPTRRTRERPSAPKQNEWEQYLDEPKYQVSVRHK